jgi:hypothetical protein
MSEPATPEKQDDQADKSASRTGGWLFPAIIILVMALWCAKDGYITPDPTGEHVFFNQVAAVVLGVVGLGLLAFELLRPRSAPPDDESQKDGHEGR